MRGQIEAQEIEKRSISLRQKKNKKNYLEGQKCESFLNSHYSRPRIENGRFSSLYKANELCSRALKMKIKVLVM